MQISAAPLIYLLVFVAVVVLVEGLYLTAFGKSISLNSRMSRRLALLEKNHDREAVLDQLRKEMTQHMNARGIPLYSILATKAQKANIAFTPRQLIGIMGGLAVVAFIGLTVGTQAAAPIRAIVAVDHGRGRRLLLGEQEGQEAHGASGGAAARRGRTDGPLASRRPPVLVLDRRGRARDPRPARHRIRRHRRRGLLRPRRGRGAEELRRTDGQPGPALPRRRR